MNTNTRRTPIVIALLLSSLSAAAAVSAQTVPDEPATGNPSGLLPQPYSISKSVALAGQLIGEDELKPRSGIYPDLDNMITGAGWISAGPGYRHSFLGGHGFADGSAAISWRAYLMAQARLEFRDLAAHHLAVGSQVRWHDFTQIDYFGQGSNSLDGDRSQYRLKDTDVVGYGKFAAKRWLGVTGTFGWLRHPSLSRASGPFQGGYPDTLVVFPNAPGIAQQPDFLHGGVSVAADTLDYRHHPMRGGLYRAAFSAYSDRDFGQFSFRRYEAEGLQVLPIKENLWVLAVHGWGVFSDASSGNTVPFYMLPSLGGKDTLRGYEDYRFHDSNLLLASAESRWALFRDIDVAAFFDAGNVAARAGDLDLRKTSWGGGIRVHTRTSTLARLDVGHSRQGFRVFVSLSDPFHPQRLSRLTAAAPFEP